MTVLVDDIIPRLYKRVRTSVQGSHIPQSKTMTRKLLGYAQSTINAAFGLVVESDTLTTTRNGIVYGLQGAYAHIGEIVAVYHNGISLDHTNLIELAQYRRDWYKMTGKQFRVWCQIGDTLILHPAINEASTVTLYFVKNTKLFVSEGNPYEVPDETIPLTTDIAEIALLLQAKESDPEVDAKLDQLGRKIQSLVNTYQTPRGFWRKQ